jgi:membrane protein
MRPQQLSNVKSIESPGWVTALLLLATAAVVGWRGQSGHLRETARPRPSNRRPAAATGATAHATAATGAFGNVRSSDEPMGVQHRRAQQTGRGRRAESVWQIPWTGWKDILWRTYHEISADRLLMVAAGVVFYGLLAIFPAITAFVSLYGLFADAATVTEHLAFVSSLVPEGAFGIVQEQIDRIVAKGSATLSLTFLFGLALALWSTNAGMKAIIDGLNVIYDEDETRGFFKLTALSFALTVGAIAVMLLAIAAVVVLPLVLSFVGLSSYTEMLIGLARWPVLILLLLLGLAVLYRFGPNRTRPRWQWVSVGSAFAAVAWLLGSALLSWYLGSFANYDATYGSLGAGIGLMMWLWMSAIVVLVGAELNAETEHQTARDSTVGVEKPLGQRGAAMADTVGEARN